jgi:hypothetical protein
MYVICGVVNFYSAGVVIAIVRLSTGANPTTFEFTATTPAL